MRNATQPPKHAATVRGLPACGGGGGGGAPRGAAGHGQASPSAHGHGGDITHRPSAPNLTPVVSFELKTGSRSKQARTRGRLTERRAQSRQSTKKKKKQKP